MDSPTHHPNLPGYIKEETKQKVKPVNLYLNGEIDEKNSKEIFLSIIETPHGTPINLYINSSGGLTTETLGLTNLIDNTSNITTINMGAAWSGAFFVFLAGEKRYCYDKSTFLYHQIQNYDLDEIDTQGMKQIVKENELIENMISTFVQEKTDIDRQYLISSYKERKNLIWTSSEALELKIVHKILDKGI